MTFPGVAIRVGALVAVALRLAVARLVVAPGAAVAAAAAKASDAPAEEEPPAASGRAPLPVLPGCCRPAGGNGKTCGPQKCKMID